MPASTERTTWLDCASGSAWTTSVTISASGRRRQLRRAQMEARALASRTVTAMRP
jgi:hypothetical protein